jgi:hypothetical protein
MTSMSFEPGETSASNPAEYGAGAVPRRTRWWSYTPTTSGTIRVTASLSTGIGMSVSIRGSASVSAPFLASCGAWYATTGCSTSLTLTAGTTYYIQLNAESTTGALSANFTLAYGGPGDDLANATLIAPLAASSSYAVTVDMTNMSFEPGETSASNPAEFGAGAVPRRTRWWSYTPTTTGTVRVTASLSTGLKMSISIRGSASVSAPFLASCGAWYATTGCSTSLALTAGTTYYIQLNSESTTGALSANFSVTPL